MFSDLVSGICRYKLVFPLPGKATEELEPSGHHGPACEEEGKEDSVQLSLMSVSRRVSGKRILAWSYREQEQDCSHSSFVHHKGTGFFEALVLVPLGPNETQTPVLGQAGVFGD